MRTLGVLMLVLSAVGTFVLVGGASTDARVDPAGTPHHHHHRHHRHKHKHKHHRHRRHHRAHKKRHRRSHRRHAACGRRARSGGVARSAHPRCKQHRRRHRRHHHGAAGSKPQSNPKPNPVLTPPSNDPLAGDKFYVDPSDSAVVAEKQLQNEGQTAKAATIAKLASQPEAIWLTDDGAPSIVPGIMSAAASGGTVPVFVAYDIPWRDCGQYSSGGAASPAAYETFVDKLAAGLGQRKAVVIVEPDALSEMSCLSSSQQQTYEQLIGYAVQHIDADPNASAYVDAGNPGWQSASTEAAALKQALGSARGGFAVNVSNFYPAAADVSYGEAISQQAGGRHFVIDTSRAGGNVAAGQWCNPAGAAIGADPTSATGHADVDALLWIKDVGESDGSCNGGPPAGQFWLSYALSLAGGG
jgi:endoglucanase